MSLRKLLSADKIGICNSFICILHCLYIPVFYVLGIGFSLSTSSERMIDMFILILAFLLGIVGFVDGFRQHNQHFIPILFIAGFLLVVNGKSVSQLWVSTGLSITGALLIAYAHYQNLKWKGYACDN